MHKMSIDKEINVRTITWYSQQNIYLTSLTIRVSFSLSHSCLFIYHRKKCAYLSLCYLWKRNTVQRKQRFPWSSKQSTHWGTDQYEGKECCEQRLLTMEDSSSPCSRHWTTTCRVSWKYALPLHNGAYVIISSEVRKGGRMLCMIRHRYFFLFSILIRRIVNQSTVLDWG